MMPGKLLWFLLISCSGTCILASIQSDEAQDLYLPTARRTNDFNRHIIRRYRDGKQKETLKRKREIALLNEDFDVPTEMHNQSREFFEKDKDIFTITEEGSGEGAEMTIDSTKPHFTSETVKNTFQSSFTLNTTNLTIPEHKTTSVLTTKETDTTLEMENDEILVTEYVNKTSVSSTVSEIISPVTNPNAFLNETLLKFCLNSICTASNELSVNLKHNSLIPEGRNVTLKCMSENLFDGNLYWYRENGTAPNLELFDATNRLELNVVGMTLLQSGSYKCVKWTEKTCCHKEIILMVYEVPAYSYHLLTIGVIAAACLIACIFLGIWRTWVINKHSKQFVQKSAKQSLLS